MVEYEKRAMIEVEDKYTFEQSSQICGQTGLIGYLRADMGSDGKGFYSTWNGWNDDLKTDEFKQEFDDIINDLREEGDILHDRATLAKYCHSAPQSKMNSEREYYGVRVDTEKYAYLLRLSPRKGDYNLYCYCYRRDWLDDHIKRAERGIRFITPDYVERFRIPDGDTVRVIPPEGEAWDRVCRYIDDYHVEVGNNLYHICEFAERMDQNGNQVVPLRSSLPDKCYAVHGETGKVIVVEKGTKGYYDPEIPSWDCKEAREIADECNKKLGVSKAQAAAMYWGSLYGFDTPGADPRQFDMDGNLRNSKRDRGDAR